MTKQPKRKRKEPLIDEGAVSDTSKQQSETQAQLQLIEQAAKNKVKNFSKKPHYVKPPSRQPQPSQPRSKPRRKSKS